MTTSRAVPTLVAYFSVYAAPRNQPRSQVREAVARYLYAGDVTDISYDEDLDRYACTVRVEYRTGRTEAERLVSAQRDRFSSGLYGTSEPVWFAPVG